MGAKGDAARSRILTAAEELFATRGYSGVTMKDVCGAAGLSRGGLYRYYASTEDIFAALIEREQAHAFDMLARAVSSEIGPDSMLFMFLRRRAVKLLDRENSFENAISEFAANSERGRELLAVRAKNAVAVTAEMIRLGCEAGKFSCADPETMALHFMWLMEGMAKHDALIPVAEADVDALFERFREMLNCSDDSPAATRPSREAMEAFRAWQAESAAAPGESAADTVR